MYRSRKFCFWNKILGWKTILIKFVKNNFWQYDKEHSERVASIKIDIIRGPLCKGYACSIYLHISSITYGYKCASNSRTYLSLVLIFFVARYRKYEFFLIVFPFFQRLLSSMSRCFTHCIWDVISISLVSIFFSSRVNLYHVYMHESIILIYITLNISRR